MKKLQVCLHFCLVCLFLLPSVAKAQGNPPPTCCPHGPQVYGAPIVPQPLTALASLDVSDGLLQTQGITRQTLVDRVIQTLFPGKIVDVLVTAKTPIEPATQISTASNRDPRGRVLLVQETRTYRVPLADLTAEEIDALDSFALTDGMVSVEIKFSNRAPLTAGTARSDQ